MTVISYRRKGEVIEGEEIGTRLVKGTIVPALQDEKGVFVLLLGEDGCFHKVYADEFEPL